MNSKAERQRKQHETQRKQRLEVAVRLDEATRSVAIDAIVDGQKVDVAEAFPAHHRDGFKQIVAAVALEGELTQQRLRSIARWPGGGMKTAAGRISPHGQGTSRLRFKDDVIVRVEGDGEALRAHLFAEPWLRDLVADAECYEKAESKGERQEILARWARRSSPATQDAVRRLREIGTTSYQRAILAARIGMAEDADAAALDALLRALAHDDLQGRPAYPMLKYAITLYARLDPRPDVTHHVPTLLAWSRKGGPDTSGAARRFLDLANPALAEPMDKRQLREFVRQTEIALRAGRIDEALELLARVSRALA